MERTNSGLSVSAKGKQLLDLVNPSLVTPELTEKWEKSLEAIASGQQKSQLFLKDIEEDTKKLVREIKQSEKNIKIFPLRKKCPDCGSNLREKIRKMGRFTFVQTKNVLIVGEKILKYPITVAHNAIKMVIIEGKMVVLSNVNSVRLLKKFPIKRTKTKMTKHEERRLMKNIHNQTNQKKVL